jgi:transposase
MARTRARKVELNDDQRSALERIANSRTEEVRRAKRARTLLMAADGATDNAIAAAVRLNKNSVRNTVAKFHELGLQGALGDLARPGRPARIGDGAKAWVKSIACTKPKELGHAQEMWTVRTLAAHIRANCAEAGFPELSRASASKVQAILDEDGLKPWKMTYYLERRDPDFERKMAEVLMVYKEVELELAADEASGAVFVSFDEKPGIQALATTAPDLPPRPGNGRVARDYEYKRLGTVSLLAGMDLVTGEVLGLVRDSHKSSDFIEFLKAVDKKYDDDAHIKVVLDNHSAHTSKETRKYLESVLGRFEFVFTPTHGSWLNLIESFFGKLARVCLKGIRVASKAELVERIYRYLDEVNAVPVVYHWKYKMDEVTVDNASY